MPHPARKRPWYARLSAHLTSVVSHHSYAAQTPDGFIRQVDMTFQVPVPGKGSGSSAPTREVILRMNPDDADTLAARLTEHAATARKINAEQGDGGQYTGDYANLWPSSTYAHRVPKIGTWGRLYAEPGGTGDFTEGLVMEVAESHVAISEGHTPPGHTVRIPRTHTDLSRFVTDDDNWETP